MEPEVTVTLGAGPTLFSRDQLEENFGMILAALKRDVNAIKTPEELAELIKNYTVDPVIQAFIESVEMTNPKKER